jgi:hypothetical protein
MTTEPRPAITETRELVDRSAEAVGKFSTRNLTAGHRGRQTAHGFSSSISIALPNEQFNLGSSGQSPADREGIGCKPRAFRPPQQTQPITPVVT